MPAPGWKTVALRDDVYDSLAALAEELERPINWTANRAIEHVVGQCLRPHTTGSQAGEIFFDPQSAEELGLR